MVMMQSNSGGLVGSWCVMDQTIALTSIESVSELMSKVPCSARSERSFCSKGPTKSAIGPVANGVSVA